MQVYTTKLAGASLRSSAARLSIVGPEAAAPPMDFLKKIGDAIAPTASPPPDEANAEEPKAEAPADDNPLPEWARPDPNVKPFVFTPGPKPDVGAIIERLKANCIAGTPNDSEDVLQLTIHSPCNGLVRVEGDDGTPHQIIRRFHRDHDPETDDGSSVIWDCFQVREDGKGDGKEAWTWKCQLMPEGFGNGGDNPEELLHNLRCNWEEFYKKAV